MALLKKKNNIQQAVEKKRIAGVRDEKKRVLQKREAGLLLRPVVTEKSAALGASKVIFFVPVSANKVEVARAVEGVYGVKPVAINTVRILGKRKKNKFSRSLGKRSDVKKAIITLPEGSHIDVFEN